ncbi:ExeA family protein [Piscinibacter sakaiensis]|uniref:ExeA family protein n=1 Tax=Piscinibacter sakaiensis TaxID=1547922 RepID=UPI003AB0D434
MYVQHFGLEHEPFSIAPDPRYLYLSERHREALAHLTYGLGAGGGIVLLTGEIGAGKTTVCRCFVEQIPDDCRIAYIFNPKLTVVELLASVCDEFGIAASVPDGQATVKTWLDPLNRFLLEQHAAGRNCVLVIDEAQSLSAEVLEQLRLLTNLETNERKLLQIILVGQPELRTMLAQPGLQQLAQRVIARYHLGALDEAETGRYLQHRLELAGLRGPSPLGPPLLRHIHRRSGGIPRRINRLCDRALLGAFGQGLAAVDLPTLRRAADEVEGVDAPSSSGRWPVRGLASGWRRLGAAAAAGALGGVAAMLIWSDHAGSPPIASVAAALSASELAAPATAATSGHPPTVPAMASASAATGTPPAIGRDQLRRLAASASVDEQAAWQLLAEQWGLQLGPGEACLAAARHRLGCYSSDGGIALVRQLARPGILELAGQSAGGRRLLLVGLDGSSATLLIDGATRQVSLVDLATVWNGRYATFWRVPEPLLQPAPADGSEPLAGWLSQRLAKLDGGAERPDIRQIDAALRERLLQFQRAHGLSADGIPGPRTLMALNRATGVDEPSLNRAR